MANVTKCDAMSDELQIITRPVNQNRPLRKTTDHGQLATVN
jgi:hypothetical protein